jgi:hypothetical protein
MASVGRSIAGRGIDAGVDAVAGELPAGRLRFGERFRDVDTGKTWHGILAEEAENRRSRCG